MLDVAAELRQKFYRYESVFAATFARENDHRVPCYLQRVSFREAHATTVMATSRHA